MGRDDVTALVDFYRKDPDGAFPFCCGSIMRIHQYRPTRFQFCNDARCYYADGAYCGCTCEGTFHGVGRGATERGRYYLAPVPVESYGTPEPQ